MRNMLGTSLLLILSVASVAEAQPATLNERERQYADGLASALGPLMALERVAFRWTADMDSPGVADAVSTTEDGSDQAARGLRVGGLRVDVGGLVIRRFKLADAGAAQLFAARSELGSEFPVVGELRGDQVVFIHGGQLRVDQLAIP